MKALITGASSGIGRDMARVLSAMGCDLILVARRENRLKELQNSLPTHSEIISMDLSQKDACLRLYQQVRDRHIDILINNAGFGVFGAFDRSDLNKELDMIDVNIRAPHILTKLFLRDFIRRDAGYILNVSSAAAFLPGPLLSAYYASKAYILHLTEAIAEELRQRGSRVYVGAFCPGPVGTEFDEKAGVHFSPASMSSAKAARYAIDSMFRRKTVIIPGLQMKLAHFAIRLLPDSTAVQICYHMQHRKEGGKRGGLHTIQGI